MTVLPRFLLRRFMERNVTLSIESKQIKKRKLYIDSQGKLKTFIVDVSSNDEESILKFECCGIERKNLHIHQILSVVKEHIIESHPDVIERNRDEE